MIRDPGKRLAVVTVTMITLVFAMLFGANWGYNKYWSDRTARQMVEWVADNGTLFDNGDIPETYKNRPEPVPIISVTVDDNGKIAEQTVIGFDEETPVSEELIRRILDNDNDEWKEDSYIYSIRDIGENGKLIILTDSSRYAQKRQLLICVMISAGESVLLAPVTAYLARLIARPARRSYKREKQFVSDASHELKTSLGAISLNAQALSADVGENRHVHNILSEADSMNRLTERLLTLSRIEESEVDTNTRFSFSEIVTEMVFTYESAAYDRDIDYQYNIEEKVEMTGDPDEFKQLAALLLENAVKYADNEGTIATRLFKSKQHIIFEVVNSGAEIDADELPRIFERFRGKLRPDTHDSFGLGLAIAKAITEKYGGSLTATNDAAGLITFQARF